MNIQLKRIDHSELEFFRQKQQESFTHGVLERFGTAAAAPIPSENDLDQALADCSNDIFIITGDGVPAGGAIFIFISTNAALKSLNFSANIIVKITTLLQNSKM